MFTILFSANAQQSKENVLPYHSIPDYPADYTPGNVVSRLIDGLGYRYYWVTEGLREEDLQFAPSEEVRTTFETLQHIYSLSETIVNAPQSIPNIRPQDISGMSFEELRAGTLNNIKKASELFLGKTSAEIDNMKVIFQGKERVSEYPFWNMINGPIADAIYHAGQVVSFRRSSGNPLHPGVSVFRGKTREQED
ncbi:DinB family protein [Spongiimicrobium sp. 3-5]|uniref:DinB family protein n=1 Tax=Spongiimicrobium sp. 3-5 TaxID=3332596 RepID=UPI00397FA803